MRAKTDQEIDLNKWKEFKRHLEECDLNESVYTDLLIDDYRIPESFIKVMKGMFQHMKKMERKLSEITGMVQCIDERMRGMESDLKSLKEQK
jgi:hypothetical protein